jgi:hypothetical protein
MNKNKLEIATVMMKDVAKWIGQFENLKMSKYKTGLNPKTQT